MRLPFLTTGAVLRSEEECRSLTGELPLKTDLVRDEG
jgi:hypothetical protein